MKEIKNNLFNYKITQVEQIQKIIFWITLVLFTIWVIAKILF